MNIHGVNFSCHVCEIMYEKQEQQSTTEMKRDWPGGFGDLDS